MSAERAGRHHGQAAHESLDQKSCLKAGRKPNITLLFEKGKKEEPGNYQLVSLTSIPRKVMEHLILEAVSITTVEKKMIRSSGLINGKSCLTSHLL